MFSELVPPTSTSASVPSKASGMLSSRSLRTASVAAVEEASPLTGTERSATWPSAERSISPAPKRGSAARLLRSSASAAWTPARGGVRDHDLGRIRRGPREVAFERDEALLRGEAVGERGDAARPDVHSEHGQREYEQRACGQRQADDRAPQHAADDRAPEAALGIRGLERAPPDQRDAERVTLSPRSPRTAGSSVSAATTETIPTRIAPTARLRMIEFGTSSIPSIATTKTLPLKKHRPARGRAGGLDRRELAPPLASLLAVTGDDEERVVDPERETHAREHVDDEDRELELLREQRGQAERDDDRHDRHQERYEPGDDRAEDEEQDDERSRQSELELAVLQVLLREEVEVVVERLGARDRHGERAFCRRPLRPSRRAPRSRRRRRGRSG